MGVTGKRLPAGETGDYSAFLSSQLEHRRFNLSHFNQTGTSRVGQARRMKGDDRIPRPF